VVLSRQVTGGRSERNYIALANQAMVMERGAFQPVEMTSGLSETGGGCRRVLRSSGSARGARVAAVPRNGGERSAGAGDAPAGPRRASTPTGRAGTAALRPLVRACRERGFRTSS
jgi:hypothetical protein